MQSGRLAWQGDIGEIKVPALRQGLHFRGVRTQRYLKAKTPAPSESGVRRGGWGHAHPDPRQLLRVPQVSFFSTILTTPPVDLQEMLCREAGKIACSFEHCLSTS